MGIDALRIILIIHTALHSAAPVEVERDARIGGGKNPVAMFPNGGGFCPCYTKFV
jgi:hypothetical protein